MKKIGKQLISFGVCVLLAAGTACGGGSHNVSYDEYNMAELTYPDYEETPADKNSWEYLDAGKETTIEWYVDVSSWAIPAENDVIRKIKEKTGITVKFMTPVTDDGSKLATLISSGLPDVVSVPTSSSKTIASLAQQGYVYDINTLADKWAPTLYQHFPEDVFDWWSYGNGKTYGLPNHYYSYEDVPDEKLQPNGGMMVRKDIFDAWQSHVEKNLKGADGYVSYTSASGATKKVEWQGYITTPEGFKAAAEWAMQNYYGTGKGQITTALQLSQFTSSGCTSLEWLAQFFAVPFEDEEGNYLYRFTQEGYADVLYYINDLYRTKVNGNNLISESNFTQTYDGVGSVIAGGKAFATLVTPQDYQMHYVTAKDDGYEYVSMYITNEEGDAPVLADIRGYGYLFNMISTNCKRPDLVVKLFDYLSSDEGQRLISLGVEGETWTWKDDTQKEIVYTQTYLDTKADKSQTTAKFGMMTFDLLINYQYYDNIQPKTNNGKTESELYRTNLKRPLTIYAYDYNATHFVVDATNERFDDYNTSYTRIESMISQYLLYIIKASDRDEAVQYYNSTVAAMEKRNLDFVIEMQSAAYQKAKEKLGITVAWPAYREGYVSPLDRTKPNGDLTLYRTY